jgi:hypothetical protein
MLRNRRRALLRRGAYRQVGRTVSASAYFRFRVSPCVAQYPSAMLRFHLPLIEPGVRISRTGLSDWLHPPAHDALPLSEYSDCTP